MLLNFNRCTGTGGSYTYLKNLLCDQAGEELTVPEGVVRIVFNNEQVTGKRYSVKVNIRNVPTSVIRPMSDDHLAQFI